MVAVLVAGCGTRSVGPVPLDETDLTVGVVPALDSAGFFVALRQGLFAAQGLHITYVPENSSANAIEGQVRGELDITEGNYVSYIEAQANGGVNLRIIAEASVMEQGAHVIYTLPDSPIKTVRQLAGEPVAVNAVGNVDYLLDASVLAENGLSPSAVQFRAVPFPQMVSELEHHEIAAATMPEPFASVAEESIGATALVDLNQGTTREFPVAGYVATRTWAEKHPGTLAAFLRALRQGQQIADTNRRAVEQAMEAFRQSDGIGPVTAAVMTLDVYPLMIDSIRLQRVSDVMFQFGLLRQKFSIQRMLGLSEGPLAAITQGKFTLRP